MEKENKSNKNSSKKKNSPKKNVEEKVTEKKDTKATSKKNTKKEVKKKEEVKTIEVAEEEVNNDEIDLDLNLDEDLEEMDFDEDLEDLENEYDEDLEEEEILPEKVTKKEKPKKEETPKKEKKAKKEEKTAKEKIEQIEKMAKEKQKKTKTTSNSNLSNTLLFLDKYRHVIYSFIGGVLITTLIAFIIWPDRIATLKDGTQPVVKVDKTTYTADDLYENMKNYYSVSLLLDQIDNDLLTKIYPEDDEMTEEVKSNAEYYFNMYKQYYNYTEEEFLEKNGFSSYDAFLDYLRLDYRRNKYLDDYVEKNLTDDEIQKYYDENVFGDINTQHVLVEVKSDSDGEDSSKLSDEDAKALAEEIITKLNDGTSWEQIQKDYKDKVTYEDLSYQSWDASLEESFMTALKDMENNSYSKEPVKTSYGYHVIYRIDQKEKPSLDDSKEKVVDNLVTDKKAADSNLLYKSLISLREEKNIDFSDTVMKSKYETYCKQYQ